MALNQWKACWFVDANSFSIGRPQHQSRAVPDWFPKRKAPPSAPSVASNPSVGPEMLSIAEFLNQVFDTHNLKEYLLL